MASAAASKGMRGLEPCEPSRSRVPHVPKRPFWDQAQLNTQIKISPKRSAAVEIEGESIHLLFFFPTRI
jgi:hypothetical protein